MDDLLKEFLTEAAENLTSLDVELVKLEQTPDDPALLGNIFRMVHTVKGTCGFLGLPRLEAVAHSAENILGKFRDGELVVTERAVSLILESIDRIKDILASLEANEAEPEGNDKDLITQLDALAEGGEAPPPDTQAADGQPTEAEAEAPSGSLDDEIGAASTRDEVQGRGGAREADAESVAQAASEARTPEEMPAEAGERWVRRTSD